MTTETSEIHTPQDSAGMPWLAHYPEGIDWHQAPERKPVHMVLEATAARFPDRPALNFLGNTITYATLKAEVDKAAAGLQRLGLKKGERVALFMPNSPQFVIFFYAVLRAGGVVVNVNPLYAEREIEHQLTDAKASYLVTLNLEMLHAKVRAVKDKLPELRKIVVGRFPDALPGLKKFLFTILKSRELARIPTDGQHVWHRDLIAGVGKPAEIEIDPLSDIALLQYTGGTTGVPKGAILTHGNVSANVYQARAWFVGVAEGQEVMLGVLPFFHVFAMTASMNLGILIGAKLVLLPRFELKQVMETIGKEKVTLFPAVPTIYSAINNSEDLEKYDLSSIKLCLSGGAPLPKEVRTRFETNTGCKLVEGYGLTESSPVTNCNPLSTGGKVGSIGLPVPQTYIEIVSLEDRETLLPIGEKGEICIRGPQVMQGYWEKPNETASTLRNGRLHTGDVGYMDDEGYTFIVDRLKDMILVNGYNVYPRNVEEAIYLHSDVEECVVAGLDDEYRGQTVKAWIKLRPGTSMDMDGLRAFLKDKISPIEIPRMVEFREQPLPKTLIGKLSRKALLEEEAAQASPATDEQAQKKQASTA